MLRRASVALAAIALASSLIACSAAGSATSAPPSTATDGYLFASSSEAIYVRWSADETPITGTVDWRHAGSARVTADFTIAMGSGSFSFDFAPGSIAGWTGSYAGDGLELLIPGEGGGLRAIALQPASPADFERAVAQLQ